jgi:hypothetical protein
MNGVKLLRRLQSLSFGPIYMCSKTIKLSPTYNQLNLVLFIGVKKSIFDFGTYSNLITLILIGVFFSPNGID